MSDVHVAPSTQSHGRWQFILLIPFERLDMTVPIGWDVICERLQETMALRFEGSGKVQTGKKYRGKIKRKRFWIYDQFQQGAVSVVTSFRGSLVDGWLGIGGLWAVGRLLMR